MRIVSVDPSLSNTCLTVADLEDGVLTVLDSVTIETSKATNKQVRASSDLISRCRALHVECQEFLNKYNPVLVFIETPSGSQSASGMKSYGVSCFIAATIQPQPIEVTPHEVKMASVGKKTASKKEMIEWAFNKHPEAPWVIRGGFPLMKQEHMADSIAVVYAGITTGDFERALSLLGPNGLAKKCSG